MIHNPLWEYGYFNSREVESAPDDLTVVAVPEHFNLGLFDSICAVLRRGEYVRLTGEGPYATESEDLYLAALAANFGGLLSEIVVPAEGLTAFYLSAPVITAATSGGGGDDFAGLEGLTV